MKFEEHLPRSFFEILKTRFTREISKFQKSELGKFVSNFPHTHVITVRIIYIKFAISKMF